MAKPLKRGTQARTTKEPGAPGLAVETWVFPVPIPLHASPTFQPSRRSLFTRSSTPLALFLCLLLTRPAHPQIPVHTTVRIGVLSLFHPQTLVLTVPHAAALLIDNHSQTLPANHPLTLHATATGFTLDTAPEPVRTLTLSAQTFALTVPGKLTRTFIGALTISTRAQTLVPIIQMDTETAVASIVAAESPPNAAFEALKAQAIASRSFLLANPHAHASFDACDTTHCQFLRSPPPPSSPAARATLATRALVLTWRPTPASPPRIVPAMYSRSCGGHTRARPTSDPEAYPFYSVSCDFCLRHPELWSRSQPTSPPLATEQQRLAWNRTHGWSAVPSDIHTQSGDILSGRGTGHGIGLCQLGAVDMAAHGANFTTILTHFFPNTTILPAPEVR